MRFARDDLRLAHLLRAFAPLLILLATGTPSEAAFSGPNGRIAFVSHRDGNDDIYTITADGSAESKLTDSTEGDYGPAWSPDGSKIAFTSLRDGNEDVYVMNSDGSLETNCTKHSERDASVHWSADGTKIVFLSNRGNADVSDNDVYVMDLDDCGLPAPVPLALAANHPDREEEPVWSPDGSRIAYVHSTAFDDHRLFTMGPDGSGQAALPPDILPVNVTQPDWAPDARKLAFTGTIPGEPQQIYTIHTDGTGGLAQLTPSGASIMAGVRPATHATRRGGLVPAWSPDGTRIAFNREGDLVFVNPHGTDPVTVTGAAHSGHVSSPDWGTGAAPSASFAISPDRPLAGEIVSLDASTSSDPDGGIARYEWDLDGDGSFETDTDQSPIASRFYPKVGTITVGLRVTDHDLNRSTATRPLTVETRRPSAFFAVSPNPAFAGQTITFDGSASRDPDGRIVRFEWDLDGDGAYETDAGTNPIASRSYVSAASFAVKLRVTDNDGATSEGVGALGARALTIQWRRILAEATLTFLNTRNGIRVRSLVVRNVPSGSRVGISCRRGRRRACTHQAKNAPAARPHAHAARTLSFPGLRPKRLRAGTLLEIRVTKKNQIGKYIRYRIRRAGFQKSEGCLRPDSRAPQRECD
jgi:Tol biopolymer transport system component